MKRLIVATASALALSAIVAPAFASEAAANKANDNNVRESDPFSLVSLAYRGHFADEGIPSNALFIQRTRSGQITARDLVEAAIARNRVSADRLSDRGYLNAVERHLNVLDNRGG